MNCAKSDVACEEVSGGPRERPPEALPAPESVLPPSAVCQALEQESNPAEVVNATPNEASPSPAEDTAWRNEISARLRRYRTRRKAPPPRYPSLLLPFESSDPPAVPLSDDAARAFHAISHLAIALDANDILPTPIPPAAPATIKEEPPPQATFARRKPARIIEFPRFAWGPPPPPLDQLAEPVGNKPRILDVPETAPPPPALGGITIEPAQRKDTEKRAGIELPLQKALLGRRIAASLIDWLVIAVASVLFGFVFWKVAAVRPPRIQMVGLAAGIPCLFWAVYQYLLIVYASTTPGLRLVNLALTRFDDTSTTRSLRRYRVIASYLSALSLGMGFAWIFLDEDTLCWHDRITRTYLSPRKAA